MTNVVLVLFVEFVFRDERERLPPEHDGFFDRKSDPLIAKTSISPGTEVTTRREGSRAHLQEQVVLLSTFVLQVFARFERLLHVPHAERETLSREFWNHFGSNRFTVSRRCERVV